MQQKPAGCNECPYRSIGRGFVHGYGPVSPKLVIIAQAPGLTEITEGPPYKPLVGTSGKIVYRLCKDAGISLEQDVYRTNVLKCQPPGDVLPPEPLRSQATEHCTKTYLQKELNIVKGPTLLLGGFAMHHMTGDEHVLAQSGRGYHRWSSRYARWVVPTIHPASIFRSKTAVSDDTPAGAVIPAIQSDIRKVLRWPEPIEIKANLSPTDDEVCRAVLEAKEIGTVAVDIENPGFEKDEADQFVDESRMSMIGLSYKLHEAIVVSPEQFPLLQPLFSSDIVQVGQNYISDLMCLIKYFKFELNTKNVEDIMLAFHSLYSDLPKRLGVIASFFTPYKFWKDLYKTNMKLYNAYDAAGTLCIWKEQQPLLDRWKTRGVYRHNVDLYPFAQQMFELGCSIDSERAMRLQLSWIKQRQAVEKILETKFPMINFNSPKQLIDFFYNKLKLPPQYKRVRVGSQEVKKLTTDKEALDKLYRATGNKIVEAVKFLRESKKKIDFLDVGHAGGKIHSSLRLHGTATDRAEAKDPNVMQVPESARMIYVADPECDLLCP